MFDSVKNIAVNHVANYKIFFGGGKGGEGVVREK